MKTKLLTSLRCVALAPFNAATLLYLALGIMALTLPSNLRAGVIVSQGFEATGDTWNFTSIGGGASSIAGAADTPANQRILSGSRSWQVTNSSTTLTFDTIDVSALTSITITVRVASISTTTGNGAETSDVVQLFVATNGAAFSNTPNLTLTGSAAGNSRWGYWATNTAVTNLGGSLTVASPVGGTSTNNYSTLVLQVPDGTVTVAFKIVAVNNATAEVWCLDDVVLAGTVAAPTPPSISGQPQSQTNNAATTATFSVIAGGSFPLSYQWRKNGNPMSNGGNVAGATASTLVLSGVYGADAASYDVVVTNIYNAVTSQIATLTVVDPIITQPLGQIVNAGAPVLMSVTVTGSAPLSIQWYKGASALSDGGNISGATGATLSLATAFGADAGNYSVVVSNAFNSVTSQVATLTVIDPVILTQPQSLARLVGGSATFSVLAAGSGLSYQWRLGGAPIPAATGLVYTKTNLALVDAGDYSVVISGTYGSVTSAVAVLTVALPQLPTWTFNNTNSSVSSPAPLFGNGVAAAIGGISPSYLSGSPNDPNNGVSTNTSWSATSFPASGANNLTAGFKFSVDTSGFSNIVVRWDQRHSGTASRYTRFQYTTDGNAWIDGPVYTNSNTSAAATFLSRTNDLSGIPAVNHNPNFAFRLVTEFESTATGSGSAAYAATDPAGTYAGSGVIRLDYVSVTAAAPPAAAPVLQITTVGGNVVLNWTAQPFQLQAAPEVTGSYTNIPGATSPYTTPTTGPQLFYRLIAN